MQIVIHTIAGTFLVPEHKQADLVFWLEQNAVRANTNPVSERRDSFESRSTRTAVRELLTENNI